MIMNEDFQVHDTLNKKLWSADNHLLPEVRQRLIDIVHTFEQSLSIPIIIVDIQLVGSNASYNYTEHSDLDVHIVANFELVNSDTTLVQSVYNMKKSAFNKEYDIKIHGVPLELYVQDINSGVASNGIYSVCDDDWIKEPKPIKSITKHNVEKEVEKWHEHIQQVLNNPQYKEVIDTLNALYIMRKNSIANDGEYGKGNAIFKEIRNQGLIDQLKTALKKLISKQLTLEGCTLGETVQYLDE